MIVARAMRLVGAAVIAVGLAGACGHKAPPPSPGGGAATGTPAGEDGASSSAAGSEASAAAPTGDRPLGRDECAQMLGHIADLGFAEKRRAAKPGQDAPTDEDAVKARKALIDDNTEACLQQVTRAQYDCAMKAASAAELKACP
jgi:hypothetical protein